MHQLQRRVTDYLPYVWQSCNTILCSTTALVHDFGHFNQISFLHLNVGTFTGCSLIILTVTGHPSMLLVLTVNSEFACPNINPKMSISFLDKTAHSFKAWMEKSCHNIDKRHHQDKWSYGITPESHPRAKSPQKYLRTRSQKRSFSNASKW